MGIWTNHGAPSQAAAGMDKWPSPGRFRLDRSDRWVSDDSEKYGRCIHGDPLDVTCIDCLVETQQAS